MSYVPFVPLRVFSAYTMLEGAIEPKAIGEAAKKLGFPAIAICDRNGLYGVMPFQDGAKSRAYSPSSARSLASGDRQVMASSSATGCRYLRRTKAGIIIFAVWFPWRILIVPKIWTRMLR